MSNGTEPHDANDAALYDAVNASFRLMDEYLRQNQRLVEQIWLPWVRPWFGGANMMSAPEAWAEAYGDVARAWVSASQAWTRAWIPVRPEPATKTNAPPSPRPPTTAGKPNT